jgi:predicted transposase/invertase (TIGR01784 family)
MFDNVCKFLAESFSADFAQWLLGVSITLTELSPSELFLEPIRADALILLESNDTILHIEFQTQPSADIPFRMIDYRLRVYRRFPQKQMRQVVVYLCETQSTQVLQNRFSIPGTQHEFEVIRLWEQPADQFLQNPGLLPFATLSRTSDRALLLRQVAQKIDQIADARVQSNVAASTAVLAGLVLERSLIQRVLRREIMQESVIYQEWRAEALAEGRAEGRAEGLQRERDLVVRQLTRRLGSLSPDLTQNILDLPIEAIETLGEALLDFSEPNDLVLWLEQHTLHR